MKVIDVYKEMKTDKYTIKKNKKRYKLARSIVSFLRIDNESSLAVFIYWITGGLKLVQIHKNKQG